MKIRIEGCTAEKLAEHAPYLSLDKEYEGIFTFLECYTIVDDDGDSINVLGPHYGGCAFLPAGARWVEVSE